MEEIVIKCKKCNKEIRGMTQKFVDYQLRQHEFWMHKEVKKPKG